MNLTIQHDKDHQQFLTLTDGKASILKYSTAPDSKTLDYYSTFVPPELRGHQIGNQLVLFALEYAKNNHYKVIPTCPFVKKIIAHHPEYNNLVKG